jgi:hypothetical protein
LILNRFPWPAIVDRLLEFAAPGIKPVAQNFRVLEFLAANA